MRLKLQAKENFGITIKKLIDRNFQNAFNSGLSIAGYTRMIEALLRSLTIFRRQFPWCEQREYKSRT